MTNIPEEVFERARLYEQLWNLDALSVVDFLTSIADEYRIEPADRTRVTSYRGER